jgi:hypothetical protein
MTRLPSPSAGTHPTQEDQIMPTIPDSQVREDLREDTTSEPGVDQTAPHRRRGFPVPHGTLTWASIVVAAAAVVALAIFAFTGRDDPATPTPDPDVVSTPTESPTNSDTYGSDDAFLPGSHNVPMR